MFLVLLHTISYVALPSVVGEATNLMLLLNKHLVYLADIIDLHRSEFDDYDSPTVLFTFVRGESAILPPPMAVANDTFLTLWG